MRSVVRKIWNFHRLEKQLARLPPASYVRWIRFAYTVGALRRPPQSIRFSLRNDGIWTVCDSSDTLLIASHRRAPRYLRAGISGVLETLVRRYFPDPRHRGILEDATVMDVGANIGEFSLACINHGARTVIAVEPDPVPFACLRINLQSRMPDAIVEQYVLSNDTGTVAFYISTDTADSSFIVPDEYSAVLQADATTVDDIVQRHNAVISVLKVEAEGAEPEVLRGAVRTLRQQSPFITVRASFERAGQSTFADCETILGNLGYECVAGSDGKQLLAMRPGTHGISLHASQ